MIWLASAVALLALAVYRRARAPQACKLDCRPELVSLMFWLLAGVLIAVGTAVVTGAGASAATALFVPALFVPALFVSSLAVTISVKAIWALQWRR